MGLAHPGSMLSQQAALVVVGLADPDHCQALGLALFVAVPGLAHQQVPVAALWIWQAAAAILPLSCVRCQWTGP